MKQHKRIAVIFLVAAFFHSFLYANPNSTNTSGRFQQIFTTAGYSAALGAALGAAVVGISKSPKKNSRYILLGASIGFITGSLFGTYLAFNPVFTPKETPDQLDFSFSPPHLKTPTVTITPTIDLENPKQTSWKATFLLAKF